MMFYNETTAMYVIVLDIPNCALRIMGMNKNLLAWKWPSIQLSFISIKILLSPQIGGAMCRELLIKYYNINIGLFQTAIFDVFMEIYVRRPNLLLTNPFQKFKYMPQYFHIYNLYSTRNNDCLN